MIIRVDPRDGRPLYLQIMDDVRRALVGGELGPGDLLPSVRELASQLMINPRTVMQAYGELERDGVIHVRRGQGTFVSETYSTDEHERLMVTRAVAHKALLEARRNGMGVEELVQLIRDMAASEQAPIDALSASYGEGAP